MRSGAPDLPFKTVLVAIPPGSQPRLDFSLGNTSFVDGVRPRAVSRVRLSPGDPLSDVRLDSDPFQLDAAERLNLTRVEEHLENAEIFGSMDSRAPVRLVGIERFRDQWYVRIELDPLRWDPQRGGIRVLDSLTVGVHFAAGEGQRTTAPADGPFESLYRRMFVNYGQGRYFRDNAGKDLADGGEAPETLAETLAASSSGPRRWIRIRANAPVRLDSAALTGTGFELEPLSSYRLDSQGSEVPLLIFDANSNDNLDPGDWIQFWGEALDDEGETVLRTEVPGVLETFEFLDATDENAYLLTCEAGARSRMQVQDAAPTFSRTPPSEFTDTARAEVDNNWKPLGGVDPWYWSPVQVAPNSRQDDVALPGLASGTSSAQVRLNVRGLTEDDNISPDHRTQVTLLNNLDQQLALDDRTFDGRSIFLHDFGWSFSGGAQLTDPVRVRLVPPTLAGTRNDVILDYIEIDYPRNFTASGDMLVFDWPDEDAEFIVDGLGSNQVEVWELTADLGGGTTLVDPVRLTGADVSGGGSFGARFRIDDGGSGADRTFAVFATGAIAEPTGSDFEADVVSGLPASSGADIVVIAHRSLLDDPANCSDSELDALLAHRASQGLSSIVTCMEDLEQDFNFGLAGPLAIRNFLDYVFTNWSTVPSYVLLLGDAGNDYKGGTGTGNFVPTQIVFKDDPSIGYYASDTLLGAVAGDDDQPEFMIGRLSAQTSAELDVQLDKVLQYETASPAGLWRRHALVVSDHGKVDSGGGINQQENALFENINQTALSFMKTPPHTTKNLQYWSDPLFCNQNLASCNPFNVELAIKQAVNGLDEFEGAAMMQFIGHGNYEVWSDDVVFCGRDGGICGANGNDTADLTNGLRLPWLQVHNCLTGGFHVSVLQETMGESWMKRSGGGAVALFAPSGLGTGFIGEQATNSTWDATFGREKERNLGRAAMTAVTDFCSGGFVEACQYYILLGDPAMELVVPAVAPAVDLQAVPGNGEVDLSWERSDTPGALYDIYRSPTANAVHSRVNPSPVACGTPDPARCAYTDTTAGNNRTWYYYVVAVDAEGFESRWSNFNDICLTDPGDPDCVSALPLNPNPPVEPTGLTAVDAETGGRLDLSWDPNPESDILRYKVLNSDDPGCFVGGDGCTPAPGCVPTETLTDDGTTTSLSLTGLVDGTEYFGVVVAVNTSDRESCFSAQASAIPTTVLGVKAPSFIEDLTVDKSGNDTVLSWQAVGSDIYDKGESVDSYEIYRGTTPGFTPSAATRIATVPSGQTSYTDSGALLTSDPYHYLVRAIDVEGFGGGLGNQLPGSILDLEIGKNGTCSITVAQFCLEDGECPGGETCEAAGGMVTLRWSPVTTDFDGNPWPVDHYEVYSDGAPIPRSDLCDPFDEACSSPTPLGDDITGTSFETLPPGGLVFYNVITVDPRGNRSPF